MRFDYQTPYNFNLLLDILARFPQPSLFQVGDASLLHSLRIGEALFLLHISAIDSQLQVDVVTQSGTVDEALLRQRIVHLLGLDVDLSRFYAFARQDEQFWRVIEPLVGLPIIRSESIYQALVFVIIEQHISWAAAQRGQHALLTWANNHLHHQDANYLAMVAPEQLATATIDDLKPTKITFKRMQLLIDIAQQITDGTLDLEQARSADALYDTLLKIKGVGHWTAAVVVARALGRYTYVPHNDVALQAAVNVYFYGQEGRVSADVLKETFARYDEFAGLAAHFTLHRWVLDRYEKRV